MVKGNDLEVDKEKCVSCGNCVVSYDELFKFDKTGKAEVKESVECEDCDIKDVIDICPQNAIKKIKD